MKTETTAKKITIATIKKFIKENMENMYINVRLDFDGMTDGLESRNDGYVKAEKDEENVDASLGVKNAWFVGSSRDYLSAVDKDGYKGYHIYNSCGSFDLVIKKIENVHFKGHNCYVSKEPYGINERICLELIEHKTNHIIARATVNLPEEELAADDVAVKSYSENEGMLQALVSAGVVSEPHKSVQQGHVVVPICKILI